jgi:ubiquitin C-terminal hydrolase
MALPQTEDKKSHVRYEYFEPEDDMSIMCYDAANVIPPTAFANVGNTCYWNALLNGLLSVPSLRNIIQKHRNHADYARNPIVRKLITIYDTIAGSSKTQSIVTPLTVIDTTNNIGSIVNRTQEIKYKSDIISSFASMAGELWEIMVKYRIEKEHERALLKIKKMQESGSSMTDAEQKAFIDKQLSLVHNPTQFRQEDAAEMFVLFTDVLSDLQELICLFTHKYQIGIYCHKACNKYVSVLSREEPILIAEPELKTPQNESLSKLDKCPVIENDLGGYLVKRKGYVDEHYICNQCKQKGPYLQIFSLRRIPTVLTIVSQNYKDSGQPQLKFPFTFRIPTPSPTNAAPGDSYYYRYEAIAQIQHSGSRDGGHYYAICRRASIDGLDSNNWWRLDDSNVSQHSKGFSPDENTHCVLYHCICYEIVSNK